MSPQEPATQDSPLRPLCMRAGSAVLSLKQLSHGSRLTTWLSCIRSKQLSGWEWPPPTAQLFWQLSKGGENGLKALLFAPHEPPQTTLKVCEGWWLGCRPGISNFSSQSMNKGLWARLCPSRPVGPLPEPWLALFWRQYNSIGHKY